MEVQGTGCGIVTEAGRKGFSRGALRVNPQSQLRTTILPCIRINMSTSVAYLDCHTILPSERNVSCGSVPVAHSISIPIDSFLPSPG